MKDPVDLVRARAGLLEGELRQRLAAAYIDGEIMRYHQLRQISAKVNKKQRYEGLGTADFAGGVYVGLEFGQDTYGVFVMELGSPEQAAAYRTAHLLQVCDRADEMRPMEGIEGGAAFYRADTNAARAVVVLGRYEVNLDICTCVEVVDRLALAEVWAGDIVEDLSG